MNIFQLFLKNEVKNNIVLKVLNNIVLLINLIIKI